MKISTKKIVTLGMLSAVAYLLMILSRFIPQLYGFLQIDFKDVVVVIGGFILGPLQAIVITVVVALLELVTVSDTGLIGLLMNFISTASFACVASLIYHKKKSMQGAIFGLALATVTMTILMLLWNYLVTPIYMKIPRETVLFMLPKVFLPFNLVKGLLNSAITLIAYRPVVQGLRRAGLVQQSSSNAQKKGLSLTIIVGIILLVICIPLVFLMMN